MGMAQYLKACEMIQAKKGDFVGQHPPELIKLAEDVLGVAFPPTYRQFLAEYGCGDIAGEEFYGIINSDFNNPTVPNGIGLTLHERKTGNLGSQFIIISSTGYGPIYSIDTSKIGDEGESPVVLLDLDFNPIEQVADDFGEFLFDRINAVT